MRRRSGLGSSSRPEQPAVEVARGVLASGWGGHLDVVDAGDHALSVSLRGPARKPSSTSSASQAEPTTGSPSTFSSDSLRPRPLVTNAASASKAGVMRASS